VTPFLRWPWQANADILNISIPMRLAVRRIPVGCNPVEFAVGTLDRAGVPYLVTLGIDEHNLYVCPRRKNGAAGLPSYVIPRSEISLAAMSSDTAAVRLQDKLVRFTKYTGPSIEAVFSGDWIGNPIVSDRRPGM